jgi:hypothetical protein
VNRISLPTSCLLDKNVVREALRGLVHEALGRHLPPRQETSLAVVRMLIAYGALLYITPELWHLLERPANSPLASLFLPYFRILRPGRYLKRWSRRLAGEGFSYEDALILSYASFGFDALEKTFGVEIVLTNDLRMKDRYARGFPRIEARFIRMIRQLKAPYQQATLPKAVSAEELRALLVL